MRRGEFNPNCALLMLDFFIRHGILTPENEADFDEVKSRLLARNKGDRVSNREESTQEGQALALKLGCDSSRRQQRIASTWRRLSIYSHSCSSQVDVFTSGIVNLTEHPRQYQLDQLMIFRHCT